MNRAPLSASRLAVCCGWLLACHAPAVWSQEAAAQTSPAATPPLPEAQGQARWVLGATLVSQSTYGGGANQKLGLRPVVAGRVGRWMVSSSSARLISGMDLGRGISTTLVAADRWSVGAGLRLTQGRRNTADPMLSGMPSIKASVALRAVAGYAVTPQWQLSGSVQQDLLRHQGVRASLGLGWSRPLGQAWVLSAGAGLGWADARAMQTFYGVEPGQARPGRAAWQPGAGVESWGWSVGMSRSLSPHWRMAGSIGRGTLLGDAARSPLTQQRSSNSASITLAYVGW